jgi:23S rRNA pseudouridine1911/1915/1917 synthase
MTLPWQPRVIFRDQHLLVLDKPPGIATTQPDGSVSLSTLARELDPDAPQLHPLSRLDTQVSGLVTFARTAHANALALSARKEGTLRRAYLGLCEVQASALADQGDWKFAIGLSPRDPKHRRALAPDASGQGVKAAHTRFRVQAQAGPLRALHLWPITGRTHQLRVHASAAGCPLLGDAAYGGLKRLTLPNGRILSAGRVMLHCAAFIMPNPSRAGEALALELAPPSDLSALWSSAGGDVALLTLRAESF